MLIALELDSIVQALAVRGKLTSIFLEEKTLELT